MESTIDHVIMGKPRQTRLQTSDGEVEIADEIALVRESLTTLAWRLHNDLKADVFDEDTKKIIENIRVVCHLKNVFSNIKENGSVVFGLQNSAKFLNAVRCITDSVHTISDEDIVRMYRNFLKKMEVYFSKSPSTISSKEIIKAILKKENGVYNMWNLLYIAFAWLQLRYR